MRIVGRFFMIVLVVRDFVSGSADAGALVPREDSKCGVWF